MSNTEYREKTRNLLKGRYGEAFVVMTVCIMAFLAFKIIDASAAAFMLYNNIAEPEQIFCSENILWILIKLLRFTLCFVLMVPLITGTVWWYSQTASGEDNRNILKLYVSFRLNIRGAMLYSVMWLTSLTALIPAGLCWYGAYKLLQNLSDVNTVMGMFCSLQLFMLGIFMLFIYLVIISGMSLAPFIFIKKPAESPLRAFKESFHVMKGKKLQLIRLTASYIPAMLPIVTIPFVLPRAMMAASVFAEECLD